MENTCYSAHGFKPLCGIANGGNRFWGDSSDFASIPARTAIGQSLNRSKITQKGLNGRLSRVVITVLRCNQNSDGALIATGQSGFQGLKLHIRRAARQRAADIVKTDHDARHRPRSDYILAMRMTKGR